MNEIREEMRVRHIDTSRVGTVITVSKGGGCFVHMDKIDMVVLYNADDLEPLVDPDPTDDIKQSPIEVARAAQAALERANGELVNLLLSGLYTDGAHHKQWYLEKALRILRPYETGDWEPGIRP